MLPIGCHINPQRNELEKRIFNRLLDRYNNMYFYNPQLVRHRVNKGVMKEAQKRDRIIRQGNRQEKYITEDCGFYMQFGITESPKVLRAEKIYMEQRVIGNKDYGYTQR